MNPSSLSCMISVDRMAGRVPHYAQRCLLIGDSYRFTRKLSNLSSDYLPRSGVTMRRVLFSTITGLTTLTRREALTHGFLLF